MDKGEVLLKIGPMVRTTGQISAFFEEEYSELKVLNHLFILTEEGCVTYEKQHYHGHRREIINLTLIGRLKQMHLRAQAAERKLRDEIAALVTASGILAAELEQIQQRITRKLDIFCKEEKADEFGRRLTNVLKKASLDSADRERLWLAIMDKINAFEMPLVIR